MAAGDQPDCIPLQDSVVSGMKKNVVLKFYLDAALKLDLITQAEKISSKYCPTQSLPQLAKYKANPKGEFPTANCPMCDIKFEYAQEYSAHFRPGGCAVYRFVCGNFVVKRLPSRALIHSRLGEWAQKLIDIHNVSKTPAPRGGTKRPRWAAAASGDGGQDSFPAAPPSLVYAQSGSGAQAEQITALLPQLPPALSPITIARSDSSSGASQAAPAPTAAAAVGLAASTASVKIAAAAKKYTCAGLVNKPTSSRLFAVSPPPGSTCTAAAMGPVHWAEGKEGGAARRCSSVLAVAMSAAGDTRDGETPHWVSFTPFCWDEGATSFFTALPAVHFALDGTATHLSFGHHIAADATGMLLQLLSVCFQSGPAAVFLVGVSQQGRVQCWPVGAAPSRSGTHTACQWSPYKANMLATVSDKGDVSIIDVAQLCTNVLLCEVFRLVPEQELAVLVDGTGCFEAQCTWSWQEAGVVFVTLPLHLLAIRLGKVPRVQSVSHVQRAMGGVLQLQGSLRGVLLHQSRRSSQVNQVVVLPSAGKPAQLERFSLSQLAEEYDGQVHACCNVVLPLESTVEPELELVLLAHSHGHLELRALYQELALATPRWTQAMPQAPPMQGAVCVLGSRGASIKGGQPMALFLAQHWQGVELFSTGLL